VSGWAIFELLAGIGWILWAVPAAAALWASGLYASAFMALCAFVICGVQCIERASAAWEAHDDEAAGSK